MIAPGRNTPCLCGSGLKYKRCCAQGFTDDDLERAFQALGQLIATWGNPTERTWRFFYGPRGRSPGPGRTEDDIYLDWLYFDARNDEGISSSSPTTATPATNDAEREAAELQMQARYSGLVDAPSDRLGGVTPRAAAASADLQPRLIELLRELEGEYERRLLLDEPAFDPSQLWEDLGLQELRDGPNDRPPPLGHETMAALLPGLSEVAAEVASRHRDARDRDLEWTIPSDIVHVDPRVRQFLWGHGAARLQQGQEPEWVELEIQLIAAQLVVLSNFELHLRKVLRRGKPRADPPLSRPRLPPPSEHVRFRPL